MRRRVVHRTQPCGLRRGGVVTVATVATATIAVMLLLAFLGGRDARAQQPAQASFTPLVFQPKVVTLSTAQGDTLAGDAFDPLGPLALTPLRLGMFAAPEPPPGDPCTQSFSSVVGASTFGMQHALRVRLSPRLTLYGFSRGGCPRDVGGGVAMTFVQPVSENTFFVLSGGAIYLPYAGGGAPVGGQVRADFAIHRAGGRAWFVGIGATGRHTGVSFSGMF